VTIGGVSAGASPADEPGDRALVADFLARRDEAAFRRLYAAHAPRLFLFLLRLSGGRRSEAEELLQETWVRAAERLGSFRWESKLATWLHGIAWNARREAFRARGPIEAPLAEESVAALPGTSGGPGEARLDLERALRDLPEGYREVLLLHDVEGYTHEEIGVLLGISPGTSKSQLSRGRALLRRRLSGSADRTGKEATP
jgi:RNA polymerase sigma-70 factor (ECF subfamily)